MSCIISLSKSLLNRDERLTKYNKTLDPARPSVQLGWASEMFVAPVRPPCGYE